MGFCSSSSFPSCPKADESEQDVHDHERAVVVPSSDELGTAGAAG